MRVGRKGHRKNKNRFLFLRTPALEEKFCFRRKRRKISGEKGFSLVYYMDFQIQKTLAYVIGVAIGDGNLSNPNGRATRLRITCDTDYPNLIQRIIRAIQEILPRNKVSIIKRARSYVDISCYSNRWEEWLGWRVGKGSKIHQNVSIPVWIKSREDFSSACLRGLLETDGSIYMDRGYKMVNFVTAIPKLAHDVMDIVQALGFIAHLGTVERVAAHCQPKYTVRISRDVERFIGKIGLRKNQKTETRRWIPRHSYVSNHFFADNHFYLRGRCFVSVGCVCLEFFEFAGRGRHWLDCNAVICFLFWDRLHFIFQKNHRQ